MQRVVRDLARPHLLLTIELIDGEEVITKEEESIQEFKVGDKVRHLWCSVEHVIDEVLEDCVICKGHRILKKNLSLWKS